MKTFIQFVQENWAKDLAAKNRARAKTEREAKKAEQAKAKKAAKETAKEEHSKYIHRLANHEIPAAWGHSYPDSEPYDHLAKKYPHHHRAGTLMKHLDTASKKAGYKDFHHYNQSMSDEHEADKHA